MQRRKKKLAVHQNHERWIVSYADFVTLLFAFFVVMFATANADRGKVQTVAAAVRTAFSQGKGNDHEVLQKDASGRSRVGRKGNPLPLETDQAAKRLANAMRELLPSLELLRKVLQPDIEKGVVDVHMEPRGLAISFKQAAFFDSGSDVIKPTGLPVMEKVSNVLLKIPNSVRLEGHTDNIPITNARFASNWDLSAARAIAVLKVLNTSFGVPVSRLAIGGYAEVAPIASNDTEGGRARNRRVDVIILTEFGAMSEPGRSPRTS